MLKIYKALLITITALFVSAFINNSRASHVMGSDISFRCLGGNNYQVVLTLYRDCSGVAAPTAATVDVTTTGCGALASINCTLDPINSSLDVSQVCPGQTSTCSGGTNPGVQVYTYVGNITIQPNCGTYTFSYGLCCRNCSNNLFDAGCPPSANAVNGFSIRATLNANAISACDNAPLFTSYPVPYVCVGQTFNYSHGTIDLDGDSLVYSLVTPLDDDGSNLTYNGGYSLNSPVPSSNGFNLDPTTGNVCFTPTQQGRFVIAIRVSEYRNGVLIGTTMRDIQIVVINCNNTTPRLTDSFGNTPGLCNSAGSLNLSVCPGDTLSFTLFGKDPDGDSLALLSNLATAIPGASFNVTYPSGRDSILATFTWPTTAADSGNRYITFQLRDNKCPTYAVQYLTYQIFIQPGTEAGFQYNYCTSGGPVQVVASGGTQFSWSPTTGIVGSNADSSVVYFAPTAGGQTYVVISDLQNGCKIRDTITVNLVPSFNIDIVTPNDTVCLFQSTSLTASSTPSSLGPFTYSWGPVNGGVATPSSATTTVTPPATTDYIVTVTSALGCIITDTFTVHVQGIGPQVQVVPSRDYVCPGDSVTLNTSVRLAACGTVAPANACIPGSTYVVADIGNGNATSATTTALHESPFGLYYKSRRVQILYTAAELRAQGVTSGALKDIAFYVQTPYQNGSNVYQNFTVKINCTSLSALSTTFETGLLTVRNAAPFQISGTAGWNTITFDNSYTWDGFSNIIVDICYDNISGSFTQNDLVLFSTAFTGAMNNSSSDATSQCNITTGTLRNTRPNTRFNTCNYPLTGYTFSWVNNGGINIPQVQSPIVPVPRNTDVLLTVSDGNCVGTANVTLHIDSNVAISAGNDTAVCNGDTAQLNLVLLNPATPRCAPTYAVAAIPYSPIVPPGNTTLGPTGDDVIQSVASPIGFNFSYFCNTYTGVYISTNGFISFSAGQGSGYPPTALGVAAAPNNLIALCWADLNTGSGGTIDYFVTGTAPNRVMVVRYKNVAFFGGGSFINGEIQLYEGTNVVEVHVNQQSAIGRNTSLGLEDASGLNAFFPAGYNYTGWTVNSSAPVAFRFTPQTVGNAQAGITWTPSQGLSSDTVFNPLAYPSISTTYVATVRFQSGCVNRDTVVVNVGQFNYTLSAQPDTICAGDTSQLFFNGNGVQFSWSPASTVVNPTSQNPFVIPVTNTTYTVTAYNQLGCRVDDTISVRIRPVVPSTLGPDRITCPSDSITLSPSGGPYTSYLWSTGATSSSITTGTQSSPSADYWVTLNDGTCSFNSDTVTVSEYVLNPIVVNPSGDTAICIGSSLVLSAEPGFQSYIWNTGAQTQSITVNSAGLYYYTATDGNGCVLQSIDSANVIVRPLPNAQIRVTDDTICLGQSGAFLYVQPVSGITYTWTPGNVVADSLYVTTPGQYTLTASDLGCRNSDNVTIYSTTPPQITLGSDVQVCACDTFIALTYSPVGDFTYLWSDGSTNDTAFVSTTGLYELTVSDGNSCTATDAVDVAIRCLSFVIKAEPRTSINPNTQVTLYADSISYTSTFTYSWSPVSQLVDSNTATVQTQPLAETTTFYLQLVDNEYGCVANSSIVITVIPPGLFTMPDAFSPNGDGVNDRFGPYIPSGSSAVLSSIRIYNRWGLLVYSGSDPLGWDGTYNGVQQPVDNYVYYVIVQGPDPNNPSVLIDYNRYGSFTLVR